jgi:MSHA biogenesis protein MshM
MYEQHFGLKEPPFSLTPDTSYFYAYPDHQEAINVLLVALRLGEGFIKVTGEVGTGKTLICRKLLNLLADEGMVTAYIPNPFLNPTALRCAFAEELGLEFPRNLGQHRVLKLINEELIRLRREGRKVVLLIDEAQSIPKESLEAIRLLTNLETEKSKLLQVVLFGQPELDQHLGMPSVRQLRQRITFSERLDPMTLEGSRGYIEHRLTVAGYEGGGLFSDRAFRVLYKGSRGIPRLANILAHKSLLAAYGEGAMRIRPAHVKRAIRDTEDACQSRQGPLSLLASLLGLRRSTTVGDRM